MELTVIVNQSSCMVDDPGKDFESPIAAYLLYKWRFSKQQIGISYGNEWRSTLLKVPRNFILDALLIQNDAYIQSVNDFIGDLTFRNEQFPVSVVSSTLAVLNSLLEEISKITPWSRCPGDPTSVKCKVKVDSYKAFSCFNGRDYRSNFTFKIICSKALCLQHFFYQTTDLHELIKCTDNNIRVQKCTQYHDFCSLTNT